MVHVHARHTPLVTAAFTSLAERRSNLERLPAYAPELNPAERLWAQLKGVELRNLCSFTIPHLRKERRDAVKRVRRKPRIMRGFFQGAKLSIFMARSVKYDLP